MYDSLDKIYHNQISLPVATFPKLVLVAAGARTFAFNYCVILAQF